MSHLQSTDEGLAPFPPKASSWARTVEQVDLSKGPPDYIARRWSASAIQATP